MVQETGAHLVDLNAMFWEYDGEMSDLFGDRGEDWGHPGYIGYQIMATGWYNAILTYDSP